jgi:FkbM family methyltransferase
MTLPLGTRLRVRARQSLSRGLRAVPPSVVGQVHRRYSVASGVQRRMWAPAVSLLRHRPLAPMRDFALPDNPGLRLQAVESRLARLLYWYGESGYEGCETLWWRRLCERATGILELGANIGYYTVQGAAAAPTAKYVAVEANPESADIVRANVRLNSLRNVDLIQAAVVGEDAPETMELSLPDQEQYSAPTGAYLSAGNEGVGSRPSSRAVTVPTVRMSSLVDGVDLLKLDIEGYEAQVLESVRTQLADSRPTIVVEVLKKVPRLRAVISDLHATGYLVFAIGEDSLHLITADELGGSAPLPRYGSRDVILIPAERVNDL